MIAGPKFSIIYHEWKKLMADLVFNSKLIIDGYGCGYDF